MSSRIVVAGRRALAFVLASLLVAAMSSCRDLADGEQALDAITEARAKLHDIGTVRGTATLALTFPEVPRVGGVPGDGAPTPQGAGGGKDAAAMLGPVAALAPRFPIVLDFTGGRTEVGAPSFGPATDASEGAAQAGPNVVYDGPNVYARRPGVEPGSGNPAWVATDLSAIGDLDDELEVRDRLTLAVGTFLSATDPRMIVELFDGAMVGATRASGENNFETVISTERFLAMQSADEQDAAENVLELWSLAGDTLDARVALDEQGRIRRLVVSGTSDFGVAAIGFEMTLVLDEYDVEHSIAVPRPEDRMTVDRMRDVFVETGIRDALEG